MEPTSSCSTVGEVKRRGSKYWVDGYPKLVEQWDDERNGVLTPADLRFASHLSIAWKCDVAPDHRWRELPSERTKRGRTMRCPFRTNRRLSITNCLATVAPKLVREWHPTKNRALTPKKVIAAWRSRAAALLLRQRSSRSCGSRRRTSCRQATDRHASFRGAR